MKIPRNIDGAALIRLLGKFGYSISRQTGSHIRLSSTIKVAEHHITIPNHRPLKIGTLSSILGDIAVYLEKDLQNLIEELFRE